MVNVTVGSNVKRTTVPFPSDTTLRAALEHEGVDYTRGMTNLDGATLQPGQLDKTFEEMGVTDHCFLMNVVKAD